MDWKTVELMGYSYYSEKEYNVLVRLIANSRYDFVIEKNGKFLRINVKTAFLKDGSQPNSWCIAQPGKYVYDNWEVDTYLVWLPHLEKFIELNGDFLNGGNSKSKRIPKRLLV